MKAPKLAKSVRSAKGAGGAGGTRQAASSAQPSSDAPVRSVATLERRLRFAEVLLGISQKVSGVESLDEVLEALVLVTAQELQAERCSLFLNDPQTGELYSRVAQGSRRREIRLMNNLGIAGHVFNTGESLIVHDAYADPRFNRAND